MSPSSPPPSTAPASSPTIDRTHIITIHLLQFPCSEAGLPNGCENFDSVTFHDMTMAFVKANHLLQQPFKRLVERLRPDCIISDMFFPWTVDIAAKLGVPRLVFHGTSTFSHCAGDSIDRYSPLENAATDTDPVLVPKLPHPLVMTRSQQPDYVRSRTPLTETKDGVIESNKQSYGAFMNSFNELEPDYVKHFKEEVICSNKAWHVAPVSLCNRDQTDIAERGKEAFINPNECLDWLGSREPRSMQLCGAHLKEMAMALEASGYPFIWVVRDLDINMMGGEDWMPVGFEDRAKWRGLIIRGGPRRC